MVSWTSDGLIAGFDPVAKRLTPNVYHLASPGTVDLNGITRLQAKMPAGISATTYPNKLQAKAPMSFVSADFSANPGRKLGPVMILAPAGYFPDGYVPKPSEIYALGMGKAVARLPDLIYDGPISRTFTFTEYNEDWAPGLKYWVLIYPASWPLSGTVSTFADIPPMNGASIDTIGRAVSIWSNRTPAKPVITSPSPGAIVSPGDTFTFTFNPSDPDEVTPEDIKKYNDDVAGCQIQYAPAPTADNPNPVWKDLRVGAKSNTTDANAYVEDCWIIKGARGSGAARLHSLPAVVDNLGLSVRCGGADTNYVEGRGELPSGDWILRVRTFDFGHPYPNEGTDYSMPGPGGLDQNVSMWTYPANANYPSSNISPWSDPIKVSVPAEVPPPIPQSPIDNEAVAGGDTVRLAWQYRNTRFPTPYDQYYRTVQIRKVGDPDWATVFNGVSGNHYVDLPPTLVQSSLPSLNGLPNGGFEDGTLDGWAPSGDGASSFAGIHVANTLDATKAHSGSRYLTVTNDDSALIKSASIVRHFTAAETPPADYTRAVVDCWVYVPDVSQSPDVILNALWRDAAGDNILPSSTGSTYDSPFMIYAVTDAITSVGWYRFSDLMAAKGFPDISFDRPPNAVTLHISIAVEAAGGAGVLIPEARFDDISVTFDGPTLDSFSMSATNQYEWRVQAVDTLMSTSDYSEPESFWAVPPAGSGSERIVSGNAIEGATLGCGTHTVEVYRRGGTHRVGVLSNLSHVDWERKRDDISTAQVVVSGWDVDCGNLLAKLQTWAYELVIWRDNGYSVDRVFEGPITLLTYEVDKVTIDAKDVMAYPYRRIIKQKMSDAGTGNGTTVVDRARRVLQNCLAPDDPNVLAYLQVLARSDDSMQYRSTPAYSRTAFEEIDDMAANAGLDYTVVGRSILLWGTKHRIGTLPEFRDEHLGNAPIVSEYGMSFANRYAVGDGNGVYGEATRLDVSGNDETYGLVEMLSSTWAQDSQNESGTYTQAGLQTVIESFKSFAERSISDRYPPPVVVRIPDNTSLNPNVPVSIQHLVPGVVVPLRSTKTLREVVGSQKLDSVKVVEEGGKETVTITLSPFSRDDATGVEGA